VTPEQAAFDAFQASRAKRVPMMPATAWTHPAVDAARDDWRAASQGAIAAALPELATLRELRAIATGALRDTGLSDDPFARDTASSALERIGGVKACAPGEVERLREQLELTREQLRNLARGLELSASATAPSKKSTIESGCAAAVRGIADPPS
jgi:hypothetical protein